MQQGEGGKGSDERCSTYGELLFNKQTFQHFWSNWIQCMSCAVCSVQCAVYSVQWAVCSVHCRYGICQNFYRGEVFKDQILPKSA